MLRAFVVAAILLTTEATAQPITSYKSNNAAPVRGDANKIVCEKEEKIGSRLGGKKICLTVAEWEERSKDGRDQTERVQTGTRVCANPPCPNAPF